MCVFYYKVIMIYVYPHQCNILYLVVITCFFVSLLVQYLLSSKMKKYSMTSLSSGKSGAEVAQDILNDFFIDDVKIVRVDGFLSDHYNPINKTLNLSSDVYNGRNIGAVAVAAHECGHAIQHNRGYLFLHLRSIMAPMVSFSTKFLNIFLIFGILMIDVNLFPLEVGVILFSITTLFTIITLPVEFNASSRAIQWLDENKVVTGEELKCAKGALRLAAMTYLLAAISSLAELLRLISIVDSRRRDD